MGMVKGRTGEVRPFFVLGFLFPGGIIQLVRKEDVMIPKVLQGNAVYEGYVKKRFRTIGGAYYGC